MDKTIIKLFLLLIAIAFISSYLVASSGYYEYQLQQEIVLTNEQIKEFEEDIKNNQYIDLKDYSQKKQLDYTNKLTNFVYNISENSNKLARKTIKYIFKKLGSLVEE